MKKYLAAAVIMGTALILTATPIFAKDSISGEHNGTSDNSTHSSEPQHFELRTPEPQHNSAIENPAEHFQSSRSAQLLRLGDERCKVSATRVSGVLNHYNQSYQLSLVFYKKMADSARRVIEAAKLANKDTSVAENALNVVETKAQSLDQQAKATVTQLKIAQQYVCGNPTGQYAKEMMTARVSAAAAFKTSTDLRSYFLKTVRPSIYTLAKEIRATPSSEHTQQ